MHLLYPKIPDERVQLFKMPRVICDASQSQVLFEEAYGRLAEHPAWPDSEHLRHADFLNPPNQYQLGRFKVACASALVNFASKDLLFDMPDPAAFAQPWDSFASHNPSPVGLEAGRPLRVL